MCSPITCTIRRPSKYSNRYSNLSSALFKYYLLYTASGFTFGSYLPLTPTVIIVYFNQHFSKNWTTLFGGTVRPPIPPSVNRLPYYRCSLWLANPKLIGSFYVIISSLYRRFSPTVRRVAALLGSTVINSCFYNPESHSFTLGIRLFWHCISILTS